MWLRMPSIPLLPAWPASLPRLRWPARSPTEPRGLRRWRPGFAEVPGPLIDGDLELVEPAARWIEAATFSANHPACEEEVGRCGPVSRQDLLRFVQQCPRGREPANNPFGRVPSYTFWMRPRTGFAEPALPIAGSISLRLSNNRDTVRYFGHIGYGVYPPCRGHRYALRACRLLLPLARRSGLTELWITANPDNFASRRTCELLGGELIDEVDLPPGNALYERGERRKCRYRLDLARVDP